MLIVSRAHKRAVSRGSRVETILPDLRDAAGDLRESEHCWQEGLTKPVEACNTSMTLLERRRRSQSTLAELGRQSIEQRYDKSTIVDGGGYGRFTSRRDTWVPSWVCTPTNVLVGSQARIDRTASSLFWMHIHHRGLAWTALDTNGICPSQLKITPVRAALHNSPRPGADSTQTQSGTAGGRG